MFLQFKRDRDLLVHLLVFELSSILVFSLDAQIVWGLFIICHFTSDGNNFWYEWLFFDGTREGN